MKTAILYLRVRADEQALRGYSLRAQEELISNYCKLHNIGILKGFTEDHSARSFKRPEWMNSLPICVNINPISSFYQMG